MIFKFDYFFYYFIINFLSLLLLLEYFLFFEINIICTYVCSSHMIYSHRYTNYHVQHRYKDFYLQNVLIIEIKFDIWIIWNTEYLSMMPNNQTITGVFQKYIVIVINMYLYCDEMILYITSLISQILQK